MNEAPTEFRSGSERNDLPRKRGRPKAVLPDGTPREILGCTRKEIYEARLLAAIPPDAFEGLIAGHRAGKVSHNQFLEIGRRFARMEPFEDTRVKISTEEPAKAAWTIHSSTSRGFVQELVLFLIEYLEKTARAEWRRK